MFLLNKKNVVSEVVVSNPENIIIFGASSFLGRNLRKAFLNINVTVYAVFRRNFNNDEVKFTDNEHHILFNGDIESLSVLKVLSKDKTVVVNCCGVTGLPDEVDNLPFILEANMGVTSKILQFMNVFDFDKLVITETYWQFDENGFECGNTLYAEFKNMQSSLARYFCKKYGMKIVGLVLYDIYGESDDRPKLLNQLAESIALNKSINLTSGVQMIDFVHIADVVNAYKLIAIYLVENKSFISRNYTRFYIRTSEPLVDLKTKLSKCLSSLGYESELNWSKKAHPIHQIYKPYWPVETDLLLPNWFCKVSFKAGFLSLINKYEKKS